MRYSLTSGLHYSPLVFFAMATMVAAMVSEFFHFLSDHVCLLLDMRL